VPVAGQPGVVTPEAVRLEFEYANLASRVLALLVDLLVQAAIVLLLGTAGVALTEGIGATLPDWVGISLVALLGFAVFWGYPTAFETLWRGRTPGKAANGLRVVTVEGAPVRFRHAAIRAAFTLIDFYLLGGGVAVITVLATRRSQRLGDLVAGTVVLRERTAESDVAPVRFTVPRGWESYARTVDVGGLHAEDYAAVRSFLLRAGSLDRAARDRLGTGLARRLAAKLAHVPPPGVSPELFLTVAAAGYQARFDGRGPQPPSGLAAPPPLQQQPQRPAPPPPGGFAPPT
jgi:uncharacterized RDD family membrane protein YckC